MSYRNSLHFQGMRYASRLDRGKFLDLNECLAGLSDYVRCTREEELAIFARLDECRMPWEWRSDCASRHRPTREIFDGFVSNNLYLAATVAAAYCRKNGHLSINDLFQAGSLAVLNAIDKFDPGRGYKFSTYVTYACRQHMIRWMGENRFIFVPVWACETLHAIRMAERNGEEVRSARIKRQAESARQSDCLKDAARVLGLAVGSKEFKDLDKEERESDPFVFEMESEQRTYERFTIRRLLTLLERDHPRHARAITLRYYLDGPQPYRNKALRPLREIGDELKITKERARQLIDSGMEIMRRIAREERVA